MTLANHAPMNTTAPWMNWLEDHEGYSESNPKQNAFMAQFWPLVHLNYKNITGADHAWCALTVAAALHACGYKHSGSAAAASYSDAKGVGQHVSPKFGAIICIRHASGAHHVTFFVRWIDEKNSIAEFLGGNQSNQLCRKHYNVSGNKHGHDEIVGCRWPVAA